MLKKVIFATIAGLFGCGALVSLWGALYWRSESMRQLPRAQLDEALYDYHAWLFFLIVSGVVCIVFCILFAWSFRTPKRIGAAGG
jgi:membrane protein required for beta-lactamase induction